MEYIFIHVLILVILLLYLNKTLNLNSSIFIINLILILFVGLAKDIGADYNQYLNYFNQIKYFPKFYLLDSGYALMILFYIFKKIISDNFQSLILFVTCFNLWSFYFVFKKLKLMRLYLISLFVYFSFFLMNNNLNALKQGIALSFYFLSYISIYKQNKLKYFICFFLGIAFHSPMIILLPTYYLVQKKITTKRIIILYLVMIFFMIFFIKFNTKISVIFVDNYRYYQYFLKVFDKKLNIFNIFEVYIPISILVYYDWKLKLQKNKKLRIILNSFYMYGLMYLLCIYDKIIGVRFSLYLSILFSTGCSLGFYLIYVRNEKKLFSFILFYIFNLLFFLARVIFNPDMTNYNNLFLDILKI